MEHGKLIVYYSLEGNTDYVAQRIAEKAGADVLRLFPKKAYKDKGFAKIVWGGKSAVMGEKPELENYEVDFSMYDDIILGFPVWASNIAPPLRTFVEAHRTEIRGKNVFAFACQSGSGAKKAFQRLKTALGIDAFAAEAVFIDPKAKQSKGTDEAIDAFCEALQEIAT